jgi:hypothetical protein
MASETKKDDCKIQGERTPSRARGAQGTRPKRGEVQSGIADADKVARTGSEQEPVRSTPPAGDWNDVA